MYHFLSGYTARVAGTEKGSATSRRRPSRPASARRSCRATRRSTPRCWARRSPATAPSAGWSTPAGRAAPTASASACRSRHTRALMRAALDGTPRRGADAAGSELRPAGAGELPGCAGRRARPARHLDRQEGLRRDRARPHPALREELPAVRAAMSTARSSRPRSAPRPRPEIRLRMGDGAPAIGRRSMSCGKTRHLRRREAPSQRRIAVLRA